MNRGRTIALAAIASALAACGGSSGGGSTSTGGTPDAGAPDAGGTVTATGNTTDGGSDGGANAVVIHIQNMAFSPENPSAPAGATIQVVNDDGATPHSMTSESTAGAFTPGSVGGISFDTGIFTGTRSFTLPASAATGTVIPFYCRVHTSTMVDATKLQLTIGAASTTPTTNPTTTPTMPTYPSGY